MPSGAVGQYRARAQRSARACGDARAAAEARRLGNPANLSWALQGLGIQLVDIDPARAAALMCEAIDVGTQVGNHQGVGMARSMLGWTYLELGDDRQALATYVEANDGILASGYSGGFVPQLTGLARTFLKFGAHEAAGIAQGAADARAEVLPTEGPIGEARLTSLKELAELLGPERSKEVMAQGAAMSDHEIVKYCRAEAERILAS